jgi:hypothetical protein
VNESRVNMNPPREVAEATWIFDRICDEVYFGFNMKLVLMTIDEETLQSILRFLDECKKGRQK